MVGANDNALAGRTIATRISGNQEGDNGLFYIHSDHASALLSTGLGSTSVMSNASGQKVDGSIARYLPLRQAQCRLFGDWRVEPAHDTSAGSAQALTDQGFTGQKHNLDLGLYYYNARFYLPGIGRFASADTIVPDPMNPQQFNRYTYTLNNPLRFTDPTGHCAQEDTDCWDYLTDPNGFCSGIDCGDQGWEKWISLGLLPHLADKDWTLFELKVVRLSLLMTKVSLANNGYNWLDVLGDFQFARAESSIISSGRLASAGCSSSFGCSVRLYDAWAQNAHSLESLIFPVLHEIGHIVDLNIQNISGLSRGDVADEYLGHANAQYSRWNRSITSGHCLTISYGCAWQRGDRYSEAFADSFAIFTIDETWKVIGRSWNPSSDIRVSGGSWFAYRNRQVDTASIKYGLTTTLSNHFP